ncbi:pilus assembly protein PilZ [Pseudomonas alcaligenes]|uniref:Pilus assembly protein PilZ n=1 Tax=Aquipseudomonas alcaligenes TaxID=43263 RepID=A0ABR7RYH1_AQUAC|nr:flagellar brake protein [Pseudomonas alcaligenes]MBC9250392.1 pilus assembly protein PilZ [Pseudomonas alcaligenes]
MSNPFLDEDGPQPPKVLSSPLEVFTNLRLLQQYHDPLVITFKDRNQRFQTYLVELNRERGVLALDEMIPNDGERFLKNGEAFRVEGFHDGVRIAWDCEDPVEIGELQGARCYWCHLPEQITYHQRRSAFRAPITQTQLVNIDLSGSKLSRPLKGQMLDISATGCRLRFQGDISSRLQPGQVYETLSAQLPIGPLKVALELRHVRFDEKLDMTFVGARFHRLGGLEARQVERFVYQLQREARRDKDDAF